MVKTEYGSENHRHGATHLDTDDNYGDVFLDTHLVTQRNNAVTYQAKNV